MKALATPVPPHASLFGRTQSLWCLALLLLTATPGLAAGPNDKDKAAIIGQPTALIVQPQNITLVGPRAMQQVIVSGKYADGSLRDLTPFCTVTAEAADLLS